MKITKILLLISVLFMVSCSPSNKSYYYPVVYETENVQYTEPFTKDQTEVEHNYTDPFKLGKESPKPSGCTTGVDC